MTMQPTRRDFIRTTVLTAGAIAASAGATVAGAEERKTRLSVPTVLLFLRPLMPAMISAAVKSASIDDPSAHSAGGCSTGAPGGASSGLPPTSARQ